MPPPLPPDPLIGTLIDGRYRVVGLVGEGGMGAVYRCENVRLHDRPCAMKVLTGLGTAQQQARFEREVRTVSQLRSVHTVQVFDSGVLADRRPYVVMELLEGRPLGGALAADGPFTLDRAVRIADQVLTALIEAHDLDIVHRDLKPDNLFLVAEGDGEIAKVLDFGIAKQIGDASPALTRRNAALGTPRYMSPEQYREETATLRADLYSLGVVFFEVVAGRLPFHEDDPLPDSVSTLPPVSRLAWMHLNRTPPDIDGLSPPLAAWLARMMSKTPSGRFRDARSARAALRHTPEASWTPSSGPSGPTPRASLAGHPHALAAPRSRRRSILVGLVAGVAGLGVLLAVLMTRETPEAPAAPDAGVVMCADILRSEPSGAAVHRGEALLGVTPLAIQRPCTEDWLLRLSLPDHVPQRVELVGSSANSPPVVELEAVTPADAYMPVDAAVTPTPAVERPTTPRRRNSRPARRPPPDVPDESDSDDDSKLVF